MTTHDFIGRQRSYLFKACNKLNEALVELEGNIRELQEACGDIGHEIREFVRKDGTMIEQCAVCWTSKERAARPSDATLDKTWVQTCRFCNKDIYGGGPHGDEYWHMDTGKIACDPQADLSQPGTSMVLPIGFGDVK